jgi:hypothetical protein
MSAQQQAGNRSPSAVRGHWKLLSELSLPGELIAEVEACCRNAWFWERHQLRSRLIEECKLQHFFGGRWIGTLLTADGLAVVADSNTGEDEFREAVAALSAEERSKVVFGSPRSLEPDLRQV